MPSLAAVLYALPATRLKAIMVARRVDASHYQVIGTKRHLVQILADELQRVPSVTAAIISCNARELRVLQLLAGSDVGEISAFSSLVERAGGPQLAQSLDEVLDDLEMKALAFRGPGVGAPTSTPGKPESPPAATYSVFLPARVRAQIPSTISDRYTLPRCLQQLDLVALKRVRDSLRLTTDRDSKTACAGAIQEWYVEVAPNFADALRLTPEERSVVDYLVRAGGAALATEVAEETLPNRTADFFRYAWQERWKRGAERNAIDRLLSRGLVYVVSQDYGYHLYLVIPGDVLSAVTGSSAAAFWTAPRPVPVPADRDPRAVVENSQTISHTVRLLAFLTSTDAPRTSSGYIHKGSLKAAARAIEPARPDEQYAALLFEACRRAGLVSTEADSSHYTVTASGLAWLSWQPYTQIRLLFEAWRRDTDYTEAYSNPLPTRADYHRSPSRSAGLRAAVLSIIERARVEGWVSTRSLVDALLFEAPLLLSQSVGEESLLPPTRYIGRLLAGPLLALGAVDVSQEALTDEQAAAAVAAGADGILGTAAPEAYRVTALGKRLLGMDMEAREEPPPLDDKFVVQASGEVYVPPYLQPAVLFWLLQIADAPARGAASGMVAITRDTLRKAFDRGETARTVIAFLRENSRTALPQNVEYLIEEVGGRHGHIHVGKAQMYLRTDSPMLLKELQARKEIGGLIVRALSDTIAIVSADDEAKLLRDLRKAGYLPVSDDRAAPARAKRARQAPIEPTEWADEKVSRETTSSGVDWERLATEDGQPW